MIKSQTLKGHLDVLLLATLEEGPLHGYAVKEALRDGSEGLVDLPTGTIYPALHRLERSRLISGKWTTVNGRRRRSYRLTAAGQKRLLAERDNWKQFVVTMSNLLETKPWPATP